MAVAEGVWDFTTAERATVCLKGIITQADLMAAKVHHTSKDALIKFIVQHVSKKTKGQKGLIKQSFFQIFTGAIQDIGAKESSRRLWIRQWNKLRETGFC